ncbi:MAG: hypothetical protein M5U26_05185 [Planctomycetota bacterium]|nr:hypothetical protein [Planctomycetota bacterium]
MSAARINRALLLAACLAAAGSGAALRAGEAKVSWADVERWAQGGDAPKPEPKADPKREPAPEPKPDPGPAKPKPPEPDAPPDENAWKRPYPTTRRDEPPDWKLLNAKWPPLVREREENCKKYNDLSGYIDLYRDFDQYDKLLQYLMEKIANPKVMQNKDQMRELCELFWKAALVSPSSVDAQMLQNAYEQWKQRESSRFEGWDAWMKKQEELYKKGRGIRKEIQDLEFQGDESPEPLWNLAEAFRDDLPPSRLIQVRVLFKLRAWFPKYHAVRSGEVQRRIVNLLHYDLRLPEDAIPEARTMLEEFPKHAWTKNGDAMWTLAEALKDQGYASQQNHAKAQTFWKEALQTYEEFQKRHGPHSNNQPGPNAGPSSSAQRVSELRGKVR